MGEVNNVLTRNFNETPDDLVRGIKARLEQVVQ
jgi:hypothetical protein